MTRFRIVTVDDAPEIARLADMLGYPVASGEVRTRLTRLLSDPDHYVAVAVGGGDALLGWVHAEDRFSLESGARAELMALVVDSSTRRSGIGAALVERAEAWAKNRGLASMTVRSNVIREASHPFYEALGYTREKTQYVYAKLLATNTARMESA